MAKIWYPLLYVHSSFAIILMGNRAGDFAYFVFLVSRNCCVALPRGAMGFLQIVIVVYPDHTHLLFLPLGLLYVICVTFPYGVLGQVCYLIVSIPDHCLYIRRHLCI